MQMNSSSRPAQTRREFMGRIAQAGAGVLGTAAFSAAAHAAPRPNVLWLSCEDMGPHLGCYGDPVARTPVLDALAAAGCRYTHCFTTAPVCAPNRSSIITGVHATTLGSHHMRSGGEGADPSLKPTLPKDVECFPALLRRAGYYCTNNNKEDYNFIRPDDVWDDSSKTAHWRNRGDKAQPFFAVFNYTGTHESQLFARKDALGERTDPQTVTPPPFHPDTPAVRDTWAHYYDLVAAMDTWAGELLAQLEEDGLAENTIVMFWADHGPGMPRCKRLLYDSGLHVPLIVRVPESLRGIAPLKPGFVSEELVSSVDFAPTVLRLTGLELPRHLQGRFFAGPGLPPPRAFVFAGRDRMDERYDMIRAVRDTRFKYIRNYEPWKPRDQFMDYAERSPIKKELNRLARAGTLPAGAAWVTQTRKPPEELYDTQSDPHELNNRADDPAHADTLTRLRAAHDAWMVESRDLGLLPEPELDRLARECGTRYELYGALAAQDPKFWPWLRETAMAAGVPQAGDVPRLLAAAESPHASIRYWAMIGLRNLPNASKEAADALNARMNDPAATVRIAAAMALAHADGHAAAALTILEQSLSDRDGWVRLQAAQALDELGETARPALDALKAAIGDRENKYVVRVANHAVNTLTGATNEVA